MLDSEELKASQWVEVLELAIERYKEKLGKESGKIQDAERKLGLVREMCIDCLYSFSETFRLKSARSAEILAQCQDIERVKAR